MQGAMQKQQRRLVAREVDHEDNVAFLIEASEERCMEMS
jgi:anti-sigma-K factor RskA